MGRFNKADKLLCLLALLFPCALWLKLSYPESTAARLLFFCLEAALVGGIADWFAVTALFRRPLGIPWHTALIPRSRDSLIDGCSSMAEKFLNHFQLLRDLKNTCLLDKFLALTENPDVRQLLHSELAGFLEKRLQSLDTETAAAKLEKDLKKFLGNCDINGCIIRCADSAIKEDRDIECYFQLISLSEKMLRDPKTPAEIRAFVQRQIEKYASESMASRIGIKMLQAAGAIDIQKITDVLQHESLKVVRDLQSYDPMRQWFIREMRGSIRKMLKSYEWKLLIESMQQEAVDNLQLTRQLQQVLDNIILDACRPQADAKTEPARRSLIISLTDQLLNTAEELLRSDPEIRQAAESLLKDFTGRAVLLARSMLSSLIKDIMLSMDTEKLNNIIYSKTEQDLIWIRLNGSVTGAVIGFFLFWLLQLPQLM